MTRSNASRVVLGGALFALTVCLAASAARDAPAQEKDAEEKKRVAILGMAGNWRTFYVLRGPVIADGNKLTVRATDADTPLPPENWREVEFGDQAWHRLRGLPFQPHTYGGNCGKANPGFTYLDGSSAYVAMIYLRGRFMVTDPAAAGDLTLSVEYRGGVVAYLNGKEVARGHMADGKVRDDSLAERYAMAIFLGEKGGLLKQNWRVNKPETIERLKRIRRKISQVRIPAAMLRKGVNVLAVEVRRSAYPKGYAELISKMRGPAAKRALRSTCAITDLWLKSAKGRGIVPNVVRPEEVQVWNSSTFVSDPYDFGDPLRPLQPVDIAACRNGAFSGEFSIGSRSPIKMLTASVSDLVNGKTKSVIPSALIGIRYGGSATAPEEVKVRTRRRSRMWQYAGGPSEIPGAVQPVTVTVRIPKGLGPGEYLGKVSVAAEGVGPFAIPVKVTVSGFTLPDPRDYETVVDIIQSPDTLALHYGVELWSPEHWKLIDRSFAVLGTAGLDAVYVPLIAETHFGNAQSMVRWIKKGGRYEYDFSILEKYLDTYEKHCGRPRIICLYVWGLSLEGGSTWVNRTMGWMTPDVIKARKEHAALKLGPVVTSFDPATGKAGRLQLPEYSDKASAGLWGPMLTKLRNILKKRGIEDKAMLGIPLDPKPTKGVVDLFQMFLPETPWMVQDHIYVKAEKIHGARVAYQANVFLHGMWHHDVNRSRYGMKHPEMRLRFLRGLTSGKTAVSFRNLTEKLIISGFQGFGRMGGDMWPVMKGKRGRGLMITHRYPTSNAGGLSVWTSVLSAGAEGAVAHPNFIMMREGLQETEARIFVERSLRAGLIQGDLARRCNEMLVARNRAVLLSTLGKISEAHRPKWWDHTSTYGFPGYSKSGYLWHLSSGYEAMTTGLFDLAAEVQQTLTK